MWCIEKTLREPDTPTISWEVVQSFPLWTYEDHASALSCFVIMFNDDQLDSNYFYRVVWN